MGRKTRDKNLEAAERERSFAEAFSGHARQMARRDASLQSAPSAIESKEIAPYRHLFVRDPGDFKPKTRSSDPGRRLIEAARHAFVRFPVPPLLSKAWTSPPPRNLAAACDVRLWYVQVAGGASFHKACAKDLLTRKEAHVFLNCKHEISIAQALVFAVAKCAGASDGSALRLARSKVAEMPFDEFWRSNIRFFARETPPSVACASDFCDFLQWRRRENPAFELAGQGFTCASLIQKMDQWHRDMARAKALGDERWPGRPMEDQSFERQDDHGDWSLWTFRQIVDAKTLAAEGNAMRHCVLSYKRSCVEGRLSIWSLVKAGISSPGGVPFHEERKLTVELSSNGTIAQARGYANRLPRRDEARLLDLWASKNGLDYSRSHIGL